MIIGIGNDICDIRRIERALERHGQRFKDRIFTPNEQIYCGNNAGRYAKRWAAKEALAKAISTDNSPDLSWIDVEITNGKSGKPSFILHRSSAERLIALTPEGHTSKLHLTLSDDHPYASAFVIAEACAL